MEPGADTKIAFIGYHHVLMMILASSWVLTGLTLSLSVARTMFKLTASSFTSWGLYCEYWGHEQHLRSGSQVRRIHNEFDGRGQHRSQRSEDQGWILWSVRTEKQPNGMGLCQWGIWPSVNPRGFGHRSSGHPAHRCQLQEGCHLPWSVVSAHNNCVYP